MGDDALKKALAILNKNVDSDSDSDVDEDDPELNAMLSMMAGGSGAKTQTKPVKRTRQEQLQDELESTKKRVEQAGQQALALIKAKDPKGPAAHAEFTKLKAHLVSLQAQLAQEASPPPYSATAAPTPPEATVRITAPPAATSPPKPATPAPTPTQTQTQTPTTALPSADSLQVGGTPSLRPPTPHQQPESSDRAVQPQHLQLESTPTKLTEDDFDANVLENAQSELIAARIFPPSIDELLEAAGKYFQASKKSTQPVEAKRLMHFSAMLFRASELLENDIWFDLGILPDLDPIKQLQKARTLLPQPSKTDHTPKHHHIQDTSSSSSPSPSSSSSSSSSAIQSAASPIKLPATSSSAPSVTASLTPPTPVLSARDQLNRENEALIARVEAQITEADERMSYFKNRGQRENALSYMAYLKELKAALPSIKTAQSTGSKVHFQEEVVTISEEITYPEINPTFIQLIIVGATGLGTPDITTPNTYVAATFVHPNTSGATTSTPNFVPKQSVVTGSIKSNDPKWDHKHNLTMYRKRLAASLARTTKPPVIQFEIFHSGGFFSRATSLGTADVPLQALLTQCRIQVVVPLIHHRKETGAKLTLDIAVREPLAQKELRTSKHIRLRIASTQPAPASSPSSTSLQRAATVQTVPAPSPGASTPSGSTQLVRANTAPVPAAKQEAFQDLNVPSRMISLSVLQWEENRLKELMARCQDPDEKAKLQQKIIAVTMKLNGLLSLKEQGVLTLESYVDGLKQFIEQEQQLAKVALQAGSREQATLCLQRRTIMQKELASIQNDPATRLQ